MINYDSDWEDGSIPSSPSAKDYQESLINGISVEFDVSPGSAKRKNVRRATAQEKEVAELLHKAHLLCLLGRGRLMDSACNDPLIQASLLSLLPQHFLKIAELPNLTAKNLSSLVHWFHDHFHVRSSSVAEESCHLALASALETREGTPEAVAALSVALFRSLNLTSRFVSILDVVSLKPDADRLESSTGVLSKNKKEVFNSSTLMVAGPCCSSSLKSLPEDEEIGIQTAVVGSGKIESNKSRNHDNDYQDSRGADKPKEKMSDLSVSETADEPNLTKSVGLKRKGDLEFQMQLEMALSATAIESHKRSVSHNVVESPSSSTLTPPSKRMKKITKEEAQASPSGISIAFGSKKVGAPLYWAEVFCSGENLTGKWVHVDAINGIIDGEDKVEASAAACKKSLRYVVAFAGHGAKDVTRRYCTKWYKVAPLRVNSTWWDAVLAPLKELESGGTGGIVNLEPENKNTAASQVPNLNNVCGTTRKTEEEVREYSLRNAAAATRSSLEDMELETRALTEPLPTNQLAYRNHHLYVIERWLKKYEILHPKGPVLGFCSGHPVYPRTCVQILHTKERWLREGLQVKADELPAKILKHSVKHSKEDVEDNEYATEGYAGTIALYGKWQTEPLCLPPAVNGIVPKNERGQVDVWSEQCLPPGTVHLPFPRVGLVAKRLDIDYAPAMVGFEFRNGRSAPVFEGIVVCAEFKDAVLQAYLEEEERKEAEEKRRNEASALSRWYQLLSSIIIRQRLNSCYGEGAPSQASSHAPEPDDRSRKSSGGTLKRNKRSPAVEQVNTLEKQKNIAPSPFVITENHEHQFVLEELAPGEESSTRVKRCNCGFSIQFEEL